MIFKFELIAYLDYVKRDDKQMKSKICSPKRACWSNQSTKAPVWWIDSEAKSLLAS